MNTSVTMHHLLHITGSDITFTLNLNGVPIRQRDKPVPYDVYISIPQALTIFEILGYTSDDISIDASIYTVVESKTITEHNICADDIATDIRGSYCTGSPSMGISSEEVPSKTESETNDDFKNTDARDGFGVSSDGGGVLGVIQESSVAGIAENSTTTVTRKLRHKRKTKPDTMSKPKTDNRKTCIVCGYKCKPGKLELHMRTHTGERPYLCSYCGASFSDKSHLTPHLRIHTGEKPHSCSVCGRQFAHKSYLTVHMRIHTGHKPYKCDICDLAFAQKCALNTHLKTHTAVKPHKCTICGRSYVIKSHLTEHNKVHERATQCTQCPYRCSGPAMLKQHMRSHSDARPHRCELCPYRSKTLSALQSHQKTHSSDKPFMCTVCAFRTNTANTLKTHMRTHTNERPFKCSVCPYSSTQPGTLNTHSTVKLFKCAQCPYSAHTQGNLTNHMKTHDL